MKKKIIIVSSNRADLGLLSPIIIGAKKKFDLELILTGSHFIKEFGKTANIAKKIITNFTKINIGSNFQNEINTLSAVSLSIKSFSKYLSRKNFDFIILLGDRFEIFSVAICAYILRKKIIHIHGGETTLNAMDNAFRNSISHMAKYHFVIHEEYKKKLINYGINSKEIFNFGSLGAYNSKKMKLYSNDYIRKKLKINNLNSIITISYHPETLKEDFGIKNFAKIFDSVKYLKNYNLIILEPNMDPKYDRISKFINTYFRKLKNAYIFKSLDHISYLSLLKYSEILIGNSSSGIIETPSFKLPFINIGKRQLGRINSRNVISINDISKLNKNIKYALSKKFKKKLSKMKNPFYKENTVKNILEKIEKIR